jgi:hypothetical protein
MNYEQKTLPITKLVSNSGQIAGVPKNPRTIKDARFNALKKSIEDAPEMLSLRELIVVPFGDKFVTICGNMRLSAARDLGMKSMPCKVLAEDTPAEKMREYAMKDNIAFGQDDIDLILAEWDSEELAEWGMDLFNMDDDYSNLEPTLGKNDGGGNCDSGWASATLTFESKYKEVVTKAISKEREYITEKFVELCQSVVAK